MTSLADKVRMGDGTAQKYSYQQSYLVGFRLTSGELASCNETGVLVENVHSLDDLRATLVAINHVIAVVVDPSKKIDGLGEVVERRCPIISPSADMLTPISNAWYSAALVGLASDATLRLLSDTYGLKTHMKEVKGESQVTANFRVSIDAKAENWIGRLNFWIDRTKSFWNRSNWESHAKEMINQTFGLICQALNEKRYVNRMGLPVLVPAELAPSETIHMPTIRVENNEIGLMVELGFINFGSESQMIDYSALKLDGSAEVHFL